MAYSTEICPVSLLPALACPDHGSHADWRADSLIDGELQTDADSPELIAAERRYIDRNRCRHRSVESIRTEPCACPSASELPIYRCELLDCDCSDLRRPQSPAKFCGTCKSRAKLQDSGIP